MPGDLASRIVWFDAFVSNVDRTARNTNMLMWHRAPWLIDHGSALYFHHAPGWEADAARPRATFPLIKDHVLLRQATRLADEDARLAALLGDEVFAAILGLVPELWLEDGAADPEALRAAYVRYLSARVRPPRGFVEEASGAR